MASTAFTRLRKDYIALQRNPLPLIDARPAASNILEWHFVLIGAQGTPYEGGCYHGRLLFPETYPFSGPSIVMFTPSGRFRPGDRICTTMSDFHPHAWSTFWTAGAILQGLQSFMLEEVASAVGSMTASDAQRREFAAKSWSFNAQNVRFCEMFPQFATKPANLYSSMLHTHSGLHLVSSSLNAADAASGASGTLKDQTAAESSRNAPSAQRFGNAGTPHHHDDENSNNNNNNNSSSSSSGGGDGGGIGAGAGDQLGMANHNLGLGNLRNAINNQLTGTSRSSSLSNLKPDADQNAFLKFSIFCMICFFIIWCCW
eukprot:ANDGO_06668.mRNA.1 Ubiquitin-conjugating enzyme E2 6